MEIVKCSKCGNELNKLSGDLFQSNIPDLEQWFGNVCINCKRVYCSSCIEVGRPTPCPECGMPTKPAQRMELRNIGVLGQVPRKEQSATLKPTPATESQLQKAPIEEQKKAGGRARPVLIIGILLAIVGFCLGLFIVGIQIIETVSKTPNEISTNVTGFLGALGCFSILPFLIGAGLIGISIYNQRKQEKSQPIPASSNSEPAQSATPTMSTNTVTVSPNTDEQRISEIMNTLKTAKEQHQLPGLNQIVDALVAVEERTNYATLVMIALKTAAEIRGVYIGELKSAYMKLWSHWHKHPNEPKYRAEKVIVITAEAAQVHPDSEIGWMLISVLLVWFGKGCPDEANDLKKHLGNVPSLEEIRKYQGIA